MRPKIFFAREPKTMIYHETLEKFFNNEAAVKMTLDQHPKLKPIFAKTIFGLNHVHQLRGKLKDAERCYVEETHRKRDLEAQLGNIESTEISRQIQQIERRIGELRKELDVYLVSQATIAVEHFEHAVTKQLKRFVEQVKTPENVRKLLQAGPEESLLDAFVRAVVDGRTTSIPHDVVRNVERRLDSLSRDNNEILAKRQDAQNEIAYHEVDLSNLKNMIAHESSLRNELLNEYDKAHKNASECRLPIKDLEKAIPEALEKTWVSLFSGMHMTPIDVHKFLNSHMSKTWSPSLPPI